jgi:hypothetical protein
MKRTFFIPIFIIFFTTSFLSIVGCNNQNPKEKSSVSENKIKVDYELQEKCGKQSKEIFKEKNDGHEGLTRMGKRIYFFYGYSNHYNKKMNKCFLLEEIKSYKDRIIDSEVETVNNDLWDINENKNYGSLRMNRKTNILLDCSVLDKECKSEEEWNSLVKPYMEE